MSDQTATTITIEEARAALEADLKRREDEAAKELNEWAEKHRARLLVPIGNQFMALPIVVKVDP